MPVRNDPALVPLAEAIARRIAGPEADVALLDKARRIGDAQVELNRVRSMRVQTLASILSGSHSPSIPLGQKMRRIGRILDRRKGGKIRQIDLERMHQILNPEPVTSEDATALNFAGQASELARLDRYERRALSKRKFAIRDFDALDPIRER